MKEKVDRSINRIDAPEKTGGYAEYIADMKFEGMLYAKTRQADFRPCGRHNMHH